jgi:hypothetical protein
MEALFYSFFLKLNQKSASFFSFSLNFVSFFIGLFIFLQFSSSKIGRLVSPRFSLELSGFPNNQSQRMAYSREKSPFLLTTKPAS